MKKMTTTVAACVALLPALALAQALAENKDQSWSAANPEMVRVIKKYNPEQMLAIAAYQASLTTPSTMLMAHGSMCKSLATRDGKVK